MFGFIIGTLSLIGLVKVARGGRRGHHRGARRWMFRRLFQHLDTTPGQEKVIFSAVEGAERVAWRGREQFLRARTEYARAMRGEQFDSAAVNAAFDQQQAALDELKKAVREGMQSVHEALTPEQRNRLADLVEFGPARLHGGCGGSGRGRHFGGPPGGHRPAGGEPSTVNL